MAFYPRATLTIPLDIPNVDIINTKIRQDGKLFIEVESRKETTQCGICGQKIKCNYGLGEEITLRHLPVLEYETYIRICPKRGQCKSCLHEPTTTQILTWYEQRSPHTIGYDNYLMALWDLMVLTAHMGVRPENACTHLCLTKGDEIGYQYV